MPKERIHKSGQNGYADLLVQWGHEELGPFEPSVRLFVIASDSDPASAGYFMFHPEDPASIGLNEGDSVGPVDMHLDRAQVNRMIRTLRKARDATFGRDE